MWSVSDDGTYFFDKNVHLSDFQLLPRLLQCSACGFQALVHGYKTFACGNNKCRSVGRCKLVLCTKYKQRYIWAYNEEHLNYLEAFVRATHRSQPNQYTRSIFATLPSIYRSKKDRDAVLKKIQMLREQIKR